MRSAPSIPPSYPIPLDGPVGKMMKALERQSYRPAHIHFIISAKGYETLTTHVFAAGDPCLDADPVFAVKSSLVADFIRHESVEEARAHQTTGLSTQLSMILRSKPQCDAMGLLVE
jgi:protocatechuate 3,4-dioxygenase beta subunit